MTGLWSQAGSVARFEPSAARGEGSSGGQELVFIGTQLDADALQSALTDCLMADGEALPSADPFPAWETSGIDDTCEQEHPCSSPPGPETRGTFDGPSAMARGRVRSWPGARCLSVAGPGVVACDREARPPPSR